MTAVALAPFVQLETNGGLPLAGGKVFTYQAGTLIPLATYTDRDAGTPNANPVILDSAGRADIWLAVNEPYKLIVQDSVGNVIDSVDDFYAGADPAQLTAAGIVPATGGTYTGLVSFTGGAAFDGTAAQDLATLNSLGISSVQNSNLWINSDASIWQRGAASVADATYGFDRIVNLCESGSNTLSQLAQPADGIPYAMRITQPDAGPKRVGFVQIVEAKNCLSFRGKELVFTARVRSSASTTIRCALVAWTGTQDAPTRDLVNNWASTTYTAGNFFVANTAPIAVTATAVSAGTWTDIQVSSTSAGGVVVPSTMNNLYMMVWTDLAVAQNVTLDASLMRCGLGNAVQAWTQPDQAVEMSRCQRYFYRISGATAFGMGQATTTTTITLPVIFPEVMHHTPTMSANNITALTAAATPIVANTAVVGVANQYSATVNLTMASASFVAGNASIVIANLSTAFLDFSAEF